VTVSGMIPYTRRAQRDGNVKIFLRNRARDFAVRLVVDAETAKTFLPGRSMTIDSEMLLYVGAIPRSG
jgi:hypothetical protein